jgi:hypothetical protein
LTGRRDWGYTLGWEDGMRRARSKHARTVLVWFAVAFVLAQVALSVLLDRAWAEVRDPEWHLLIERLRQRRAEAPGRPLVVVLGSSRSLMVLDAARLSQAPSGPLVFNAAVPGGGALVQRVFLERLVEQGIRPNAVVLEVMPPYFSAYGTRLEESFPAWQRLTLAELLHVASRAQHPGRVVKVWLKARLLPVCYHQGELQRRLVPAALCPASEAVPGDDRDGHGWKAGTAVCSAERRAELTRFMLEQYDLALRSPGLCRSRVDNLDGLLGWCRQEGIGCILLMAPEDSQFRTRTAVNFRKALDAALAGLARDHGALIHDARDWLPDEDFLDGHHATRQGAARFTTRFEPVLKAESVRSRQRVLRDARVPTVPGRPGGSLLPGS